jgi:hypothetical protein
MMGVSKPSGLSVSTGNGHWTYDATHLVLSVSVDEQPKSDAFIIAAWASGPVVALGREHNQRVVREDVGALQADTVSGGSCEIESILSNPELSDASRAAAVARCGGPLCAVHEFNALQEATERLGRVIIGLPADKSPTDVSVVFELNREGRIEHYPLHYPEAVEDLIIDTPFAFDGAVRRTSWHATVHLGWDDHMLARSYASRPLLPGIYAWRVLLYDAALGPMSLGEARRAEAAGSGAVVGLDVRQEPSSMGNLCDPLRLRLSALAADELPEAQAPGAYLVTTVNADEATDAVLRFVGPDDISVAVNGHEIDVLAEPTELGIPSQFRPPSTTNPISLARGRNELVVHTQAAPGAGSSWLFEGEFVRPDGGAIAHLSYSSPNSSTGSSLSGEVQDAE